MDTSKEGRELRWLRPYRTLGTELGKQAEDIGELLTDSKLDGRAVAVMLGLTPVATFGKVAGGIVGLAMRGVERVCVDSERTSVKAAGLVASSGLLVASTPLLGLQWLTGRIILAELDRCPQTDADSEPKRNSVPEEEFVRQFIADFDGLSKEKLPGGNSPLKVGGVGGLGKGRRVGDSILHGHVHQPDSARMAVESATALRLRVIESSYRELAGLDPDHAVIGLDEMDRQLVLWWDAGCPTPDRPLNSPGATTLSPLYRRLCQMRDDYGKLAGTEPSLAEAFYTLNMELELSYRIYDGKAWTAWAKNSVTAQDVRSAYQTKLRAAIDSEVTS